MSTITLYPASETYYTDMGWRDMYRMFTRAENSNPYRNNFGVLHVFNAGTILPKQGYRMHPHDNVEIVSVPLDGTWEHKDTQGNKRLFKKGEVQAMTAGTGLAHSEFNASSQDSLTSMQFWLFTNKYNVTPRYDLYDYGSLQQQNEWTQIVSPNYDDAGVRIQQDAWFNIGRFDIDKRVDYPLHNKEKNGVFIYILKGQFEIAGHILRDKDAIGLEAVDRVSGKSLTQDAEILVIEVPMEIDGKTLYF